MAFISCGLGVISAISMVPAPVRGLALLVFVLVGPGAAAMLWIPDLPTYARRALIPLVGLAASLALSTLALTEGFWHPAVQLLGMILVTAAAAAASSLASAETLVPADVELDEALDTVVADGGVVL